ncbi:MAG: hypothetical protein KGO52_13225 [Nitrospirota bacterium]|nr:hypothetical protein [Nitrospirota bacterium]MDE3034367.1 hypothetical protein [Nitrospirota bacterium]MDE3118441.1 hypothetical protein [Nitrospirota bacterium]MDE3226610.1 hypothetical protein [Nitrospirota bacterium]MDE3243673.1 hypothetical protein [Nitrospirota bacterium]
MAQLVKACPRCGLLMWVQEGQIEYLNENTVRTTCPHCKQLVRVTLVSRGANAAGPKMGH